MPRPGCLALFVALASANLAPAQSVTRADLKPGLVFTAAGAKPGETYTRIDPAVALTLAPGEAVHPRLAGEQSFTWAGYLNVITPGKYKFDAVLLGKLAVTVGGKPVLSAEAAGNDPAAATKIDGPELDLFAGIQPIAVTLTRTGPAVRAELIWKGPNFRPEPVPYFFFGHRPGDRPAGYAVDLARDHGRLLFEELSCARCHKPDAADGMAKTLVERSGPDLTEVGRRAYPGWLDAWLADPQKLRPHTAMPKLFADDATGAAERYAVTAYLASLGGPARTPPSTGGLFGGSDGKNAANGQKLYVTLGCAACHGDKVNDAPTGAKPRDDGEDDKPAVKPEDTYYSIGTAGPQGYYRLGAVGSKFTPPALAKYLQNPLATNPHGRMPGMVLAEPEARDLATFLVKATDPKLPREMPKPPAEKSADEWKRQGKELLTAKGCANCHAVSPGGTALAAGTAAPGLAALTKPGPKAGCLAETPPPGKVPVYALTAGQRSALAAFLADGFAGPGSPAPGFQARLAIKRFNCLNCHSRDGEGGIPETLAGVMKSHETAENAEDLLPPRLSGTGHKLLTPWLTQVLTQAGRARPWMGLRMPQYGEANVGFLPHALPKLEGTVPDDAVGKVALTPAKVEAGKTLAGKTASGFGCIACHDISGVRGGGTRGPDLATIDQRLRLDWYTRWMHQPQRMAPGTKMPQNFFGDTSQITTVLGGNADAQIDALWAYLSLGPGLPLPAGIEPPGKALAVPVKDRPEVLRTFLPDAGSKAVAVGYPGGTSVAFDAAECRLAYAWAGNFLDAGPVWGGRGGQPANLLGAKFWAAPPGHPWAVTDSRTPPDFAARAADPAYGRPLKDDALYAGPRRVHFRGYALDSRGTPSFRYALDAPDGRPALAVTETPAPLPPAVASGITRTFAVEVAPNRTAWLLAATATKEPRRTGTRVVAPQPNGGATVLDLASAPSGAAWEVAPAAGGWQVLLRLPEAEAGVKADVTLRVWALQRDEEGLLKALK